MSRKNEIAVHDGRVIHFMGIFTDEIRRAMAQKRYELGLTYRSVAKWLDVNWSTYRKWELGETVRCTGVFAKRIQWFLNGGYDNAIHASGNVANNNKQKHEHIIKTTSFTRCLERISSTYNLCRHNKKLVNKLITDCNAIFKNTISALIHSEEAILQ